MFRKIVFTYLLFVLALSFSACSAMEPKNTPTLEEVAIISTATVTTTQSILTLTTPTETPTPTKDTNLPLDATSVPTIVAKTIVPPKTILSPECPILVDKSHFPLWTQGSILFNEGNIVDEIQSDTIFPQPGIWAVSTITLTKYLVQEISGGVWISPDGMFMLDTIRDVENSTQVAVFYDIVSGNEKARLALPYDYGFRGWFQGDRVQFGNVIERIEGMGELRGVAILDPVTQRVENFTEELNLPEFAFNDAEVERGLFYGYAAVDPTGQLILYSAKQNDSDEFEVRLLNLETGDLLWQHNTQYLSSSTPQWSKDGSSVLFDINVSTVDTQSRWDIIALNRDGQVVALPSQPFPFIEEGQLIQYSSSLDGQYLFYEAWELDEQNIEGKIRAFIVDVMTGEVNEICDPETSFVASVPAHGRIGLWLPDNQFVYRALFEKDGQSTHSLRVLDIPIWTTQVIFEPDAGYGVNVFGWTPVQFP